MATKFLGKVVASAALGGMSLLIAPGMAHADGGHAEDGRIFTHPKWTKAGHEVTIIEVCPKPQEHAYVWSKVTGKLHLKPADGDRGGKKGREDKHGSDEYEENGSYDKKGSPSTKEETDKSPEKGDKEWTAPKDSPDGRSEEKGSGAPDKGGEGGGLQKSDDKSHKSQKDENDKKTHDDKKDSDNKDYSDKGSDDKGHGDKGHGDEEGKKGDNGEFDRGDKNWVYTATVKLPRDAKPGRYELHGSCAEGTLLVTPKGWVDGGDGGAGAGTDPALAASGAGMLGAAALGGILLMRRRRTDGSPA